jgi:hypothetical protein
VGTGRPQGDARSIAEHKNAAEVVGEHHDAKRQPEPSEHDEHGERDGDDDAAVVRHGDQALAHAREQMAGRERLARFGNLDPESRPARRRDVRSWGRGFDHFGGGCEGRIFNRRWRLGGIGKLFSELARDGIRVQADGLRVSPHERPPVNAGRPPRHVSSFEGLKEGDADFRIG